MEAVTPRKTGFAGARTATNLFPGIPGPITHPKEEEMKRHARSLITVFSFVLIVLGAGAKRASARGPWCLACVEECDPPQEEWIEACWEFCNERGPAWSEECFPDTYDFCELHPGLMGIVYCEVPQ
jgi:hypothetical protein